MKLEETGAQLFIERLLVLLALANWPCFHLLFRAPNLIMSLDVDGAVSTEVEIAVGLSGFSLWKVLTNLHIYWMAKGDS